MMNAEFHRLQYTIATPGAVPIAFDRRGVALEFSRASGEHDSIDNQPTILGILSDSHGRGERTARAIEMLRTLGATHFAYCGDVCGESVLDALAGQPVTMVWGNNDIGERLLYDYARLVGLATPSVAPAMLELGGRKLAIFHGHEEAFAKVYRAAMRDDIALIDRLIGGARIVLYGHTHLAADDQIGSLRFINPGALQRASVYTVATLDLETEQARFWVVDDYARPGSEPSEFASPRRGK